MRTLRCQGAAPRPQARSLHSLTPPRPLAAAGGWAGGREAGQANSAVSSRERNTLGPISSASPENSKDWVLRRARSSTTRASARASPIRSARRGPLTLEGLGGSDDVPAPGGSSNHTSDLGLRHPSATRAGCEREKGPTATPPPPPDCERSGGARRRRRFRSSRQPAAASAPRAPRLSARGTSNSATNDSACPCANAGRTSTPFTSSAWTPASASTRPAPTSSLELQQQPGALDLGTSGDLLGCHQLSCSAPRPSASSSKAVAASSAEPRSPSSTSAPVAARPRGGERELRPGLNRERVLEQHQRPLARAQAAHLPGA